MRSLADSLQNSSCCFITQSQILKGKADSVNGCCELDAIHDDKPYNDCENHNSLQTINPQEENRLQDLIA